MAGMLCEFYKKALGCGSIPGWWRECWCFQASTVTVAKWILKGGVWWALCYRLKGGLRVVKTGGLRIWKQGDYVYKRINIPEFCFSFFITFLSWNALIGFKLVNGGENLLRLLFPWDLMTNTRLKTFKSLERHCSKIFCSVNVTIGDCLLLQAICITSTALCINLALASTPIEFSIVRVTESYGLWELYWDSTWGDNVKPCIHHPRLRDGTECTILRRLPVRDKHQYS